MRVGIVGSRGYPDLEAVKTFVMALPRDVIVVSGGARGVDSWALETARMRGLETETYLPNWSEHGKRAGAMRNQYIVDGADEIVAFWDGTSRGTAITMEMAKRAGKTLRVYQPGLPVVVQSPAAREAQASDSSTVSLSAKARR